LYFAYLVVLRHSDSVKHRCPFRFIGILVIEIGFDGFVDFTFALLS